MSTFNQVITIEELRARVGTELGVSSWRRIDQSHIDLFAQLTDDHQPIHVDPIMARDTPLGTTIAHGFLTLSLVAPFSYEAVPGVEGTKMSMNYGFNKLRFVAPVKSGASVRGRFSLKSLLDQGGGRYLCTMDVVVEIEGEPKPAVVLEWLTLTVV
jgi:acyl dehydratase